MPHRVLVIDDEEEWRGVLQDTLTVMGCESDAAGNLDEVQDFIKTNQYDLVLLDITLHEARPVLDFDLICNLLRDSHPDLPIVAISGKPIEPAFMFNLSRRGAVIDFISKYDDAIVTKLQELIKELAPSQAVLDADELQYQVEDQPWYASQFPPATEIDGRLIETVRDEIEVVIITATNVEIRAVAHLLKPYPGRRKALMAYVGPETYYLGLFGEFKAVITSCRVGAVGEGSVILAVEQAQRIWGPKAIIMAGIAFGRDATKQKIGDVLVASQVISYEQQRVGQNIIFRGTIPPSNTHLLNRFENTPNWSFTRPDGKLCNVIIGPILSGEKLVDNARFKAGLFREFPHAIGGEMEGAGFFAALGRVGIAGILVKGICDWGDGTKSQKHQPLAAAAAASLVHHVLSKKTALDSLQKK